jgi:hypothetical protein
MSRGLGLNSQQRRWFLSFPYHLGWFWDPSSFLPNILETLLHGVMLPRHETDHSTQFSAQLHDSTPLPHMWSVVNVTYVFTADFITFQSLSVNTICPGTHICIVLEVVSSSINCKSNHEDLASEPATNDCFPFSLQMRFTVWNGTILIVSTHGKE